MAEFNKVLIVRHEKQSEKHEEATAKVIKILNKLNKEISCVKCNELKDAHFKDKDLVIAIGGDGTFIQTSHFLNQTPILGINSEPEVSEGALSSLKGEEIDFLDEILTGKYRIIQRPRVKVRKNGELIERHALNEVYIGSETQFHTSRYIIKLNGNEEEHRSSGVLVVTGSGSNAWYKSAGGKPFHYAEKKLKFLTREPFVRRVFKPKILNGEIKEGEKIIFESKRSTGGIIAIDSHLTYDFNIGDCIEIELSNCPLNVIERM